MCLCVVDSFVGLCVSSRGMVQFEDTRDRKCTALAATKCGRVADGGRGDLLQCVAVFCSSVRRQPRDVAGREEVRGWKKSNQGKERREIHRVNQCAFVCLCRIVLTCGWGLHGQHGVAIRGKSSAAMADV